MNPDIQPPDIASVCVHLKTKKCPTCGASASSYHRPWVHSFGEYREELGFSCGCTVAWTPNFSREEIRVPCPDSPAARHKFVEKIEELKGELEEAKVSLQDFDRRRKQNKLTKRGDHEQRAKTERKPSQAHKACLG